MKASAGKSILKSKKKKCRENYTVGTNTKDFSLQSPDS